MATARHIAIDSDVRFSCSLCMEPYRGRTPKLLPCFHTFCLPCLESIATSAALKQSALYADNLKAREEEEDIEDELMKRKAKAEQENDDRDVNEDIIGENEDKNASFQCPLCHVTILVPEGGVSHFQTNFYLDVDDPSDFTPPVVCDTCEEGSRDKATHECADCRSKMCSRCSHLHTIHAQGHRIRPLDVVPGVSRSATRVPKPRECPSHAGQSLCFHCRQCDVSICLHCKLTSHEGHATEDFLAAFTRAKEEVTRLIVAGNQQIQLLESVLGRLERDLLELSRTNEEITSSVSSRYKALVAWATRARDETLEEAKCVERAVMKEIEAERILARDTKQLLSHLVARATYSCQTDADVDIVLHKSELQAALLRDDALDRYRKRGSKEGDVKFFTCRSDDKSIHLDQVRDFVGRQEGLDQSQKDKMEVMSMRELSETAQELVKSLDDLKSNVKRVIAKAMKTVSYKVRRSTNIAVTPGNAVVLDEVEFNEGDCYDKTTGVFTVPVNGTYVFVVSLYTNLGTNAGHCSLSIDGDPVDFMTVVNNFGTIHDMLNLSAGQKVSLMAQSSYQVNAHKQHTFFTGALVRSSLTDE